MSENFAEKWMSIGIIIAAVTLVLSFLIPLILHAVRVSYARKAKGRPSSMRTSNPAWPTRKEAYHGNEAANGESAGPYIFVSYAHADAPYVIPILDFLTKNGFHIWYDQAIRVGSEWPSFVEDRLLKCECMLSFISQKAVESQNCRNEINLAITEKKDILVVYLEETQLRHGLNLQLGTRQSLFAYRHGDQASLLREVMSAALLQRCRY